MELQKVTLEVLRFMNTGPDSDCIGARELERGPAQHRYISTPQDLSTWLFTIQHKIDIHTL